MNMSLKYEALVEEIDRIVNSPYPTELRSLRDHLCVKCTGDDISRLVLSRPCQLDRLVECVLNGLRQWPYVLDIVTRLSHNTKVRNAFLRKEPTLLHDVVEQAVQHGIDSKYTATAVTLLSRPLPKDVTLPSEVQTLFIHLFDHAAQQPSVSSVRSLYQILQGISTSLFGLLSSNVLFRFEDHLFGILRNLKGDDPSLCLYTLAIMRIMATAPNEHYNELSTSSYDTQELLASTQLTPSTRWQPETVQQYFTERKGQKTMQLIVLRVMWACTPTTGESIGDKMESLALANEIIAAVPPSERETWRKANTLVPKKFEEKVFATGLEPALRFQALCFLVRLGQGSTGSTAVMNGLRQIIVKMDTIMEALCGYRPELTDCLTSCEVFDESTTTMFLQNVVDFAATAVPDEMVQKSGLLVQLLRDMLAAMSFHDAIVGGAMLALDVVSCGTKLHAVSRLVGSSQYEQGRGAGANSCAGAAQSTRNDLVHELCKLFLRAALCTNHELYSISQSTLSLLLDLHASSTQSSPTCSHSRPEKVGLNRVISFVEAESTPDNNTDWRQALRSELSLRNTFECERLESLFVKACGELETRCQDIEKPLQEVKQQKCALQERYDELQRTYARLESESIDRTIQFNVLEVERDQYFTGLESLREENTRLNLRCQELEQSLLNVEDKAMEEVTEERQLKETAELEHATMIAEKEEKLEEIQEQLGRLRGIIQSRDQELQNIQSERNDTEVKARAEREEMELLQKASREQQALIDRLTEDNDNHVKENEHFQAQISTLKIELKDQQEAYRAETNQLKTEMNQNLDTAAINHKLNFEQLTTNHEAEVKDLKRKLSEIEDMSRLAQERNTLEIEERDDEIEEHKKKLDRLNRKCEQKDKQIAEANAMRRNLMAAMGFGANQTPMALPHRPSQTSVTHGDQQESETQENASPPTPLSGDDIGTQNPGNKFSVASNDSSNESRSGPTPKRARSRRSMKVASPAQPPLSTGTATRTTRSATKRQTLSNIGANPSIKKPVPPKTPSNARSTNPDDTTFDGSELFSGTPA